jgi:hypothetical protein
MTTTLDLTSMTRALGPRRLWPPRWSRSLPSNTAYVRPLRLSCISRDYDYTALFGLCCRIRL